jgi:hypothetical protein
MCIEARALGWFMMWQTINKHTKGDVMYDLYLKLPNQPGALAKMGQVLGEHGLSLEGGGVFGGAEFSDAHFLLQDGPKAQQVLEDNHFNVLACHPVLVRRLKQDVPGQLGAICQRLADANINIQTQYSDHNNQLILVLSREDMKKAESITQEWQP